MMFRQLRVRLTLERRVDFLLAVRSQDADSHEVFKASKEDADEGVALEIVSTSTKKDVRLI